MHNRSKFKRARILAEQLLSPDHLTLIVKSHLYLENALNDLILGFIPHPERLDIASLTFAEKHRIAAALGLTFAETVRPISYVNTLRNKLVHDVNFVVTMNHINTLLGMQSLKQQESIKSTVKSIVGEAETKRNNVQKYQQLLTLSLMLSGLITEVETKKRILVDMRDSMPEEEFHTMRRLITTHKE